MNSQYEAYSYSSSEKNAAICRKDLDLIPNGNFLSNAYEECRNMTFLKVNGVARFWDQENEFSISGIAGDILNSIVLHGVPFAYAILGDQDGIHVYLGTMKLLVGGLKSSYESFYPGINIEVVKGNPLHRSSCAYGGLFTGIPTDKLSSEDKKGLQIESICRGMQGSNFIYLILASGISNVAVSFGHERILKEMEDAFSLISQTISGGAQGNISAQRQDFQSKNYFENLELMERYLKSGESRGMWRVNGYYASDTQSNARRLGNIIKASFSGDESKPDQFRTIPYNSIRDVVSNVYMMADLLDNPTVHPVGQWMSDRLAQPISLYVYKFQTLLNSDQLAVLSRLPSKEFPGYYVDDYVEFDVSNRVRDTLQEAITIGEICNAGSASGQDDRNPYLFEKNDFTRHTLIIGITGGGKTNTSKSILNTLWNTGREKDRVPFMVIESAKREYWELRNLKGFEDLLVFTLGAEAERSSVRYRINPFETCPGISLQTHIDYLLSTFKAAFDLYPPMPYVLEKAVYEVYEDRGWDITENQNRYGFKEYPTLNDLYHKVDVVVERMGYNQEVQSNVKAALQARIYSLMIGGKGAMLNTPRSVPIEKLLSRPVVLELEDLGDDDTKSFVIGILLVQLYEYRKSQMTKGSKRLSHILMVEEAHRLLKRVSEGGEGGSTRAKSVEFFCNMLAEIRTFGQGMIIADQIPTKIAPDTIKNTNLKIVHRTVALEDREAIGRAMNMSPNQIEYLSCLKRGYAAVYAEGDNKPKCVKLPLVRSYYQKERDEVIDEVKRKVYNLAGEYDQIVSHHVACSFCEKRCAYYNQVRTYIDSRINVEKVLTKLSSHSFDPRIVDAFLESGIMKELVSDARYFIKTCVIGYILEQKSNLSYGAKQQILAEYYRYKYLAQYQ